MRLQKTSSKPANMFLEVCFHSETSSPSSASLFSPIFEPSCSRTGGEISRFLPVAAAALILNRCRPPASTGFSVSLFAGGQANFVLGPSEETGYRRVQGRVRVLDSNGNRQRSLPQERFPALILTLFVLQTTNNLHPNNRKCFIIATVPPQHGRFLLRVRLEESDGVVNSDSRSDKGFGGTVKASSRSLW